jgi:ubiquinone/menaquinone biosynthesis C-methylase UbiE
MERSSPVSLTRQQLAEDSHWWFATRTRALFAILDGILPRRDLRILDVGCGAGNMIHHLSRYGRVVGIDNNPLPLKVAQERGYDARMASAEAIPFPEGSFDLVAALDVIEHCEDDLLILRECQRILVSGGWLVATLPAFGWLWSANDEINKHKRRYTKGEWHRSLRQAGLVPLRTTYSYFAVFPLAATRIMLQRGKTPKISTPETNKEAYQVEMEPTSPLLNSILTVVGMLEAQLLHLVDLPFGTSIISVAQKGPHG